MRHPRGRRTRGRSSRKSGQALVEFALILPILLLLVLGLVDFARAWNAFQVITDAAREGARTAVIDDPTILEQDVRDKIDAALTRASLKTANRTVTINGFRSGRGNPATVRIEYEYELNLVGAMMALASGDRLLTLTSEIVMRNE